MRVLLFTLLAATMWAAEVCPGVAGGQASGAADGLSWHSYRGEPHPGKYCIGNELRNAAPKPIAAFWPDAGIQKAVVREDLKVQECCFDRVEEVEATLHYGEPPKTREIRMQRAAEEGLAGHREGYPDLIEEDARIRLVSIRGTLWAGARDVRVDLVLKCSASQFAKQFAYQYSITDRSSEALDVEWSLLSAMKTQITPSVQPIPSGKTYLFISNLEPKEADGTVELRLKSGVSAGVFRLQGFAQ